MGDAPRFLSKSSAPPYVSTPAAGWAREPEPVGEDDLEAITEQAHEHAEDARRHEWKVAVARVEKSLAHHAAQAQHCERELRRLRRKLGERRYGA